MTSIIAQEPNLQRILTAASSHYKVTREQMMSRDRAQAVVTARQVSMYIALTKGREPTSSVAVAFRTTPAMVLNHVKVIKPALKTSLSFIKKLRGSSQGCYGQHRMVHHHPQFLKADFWYNVHESKFRVT